MHRFCQSIGAVPAALAKAQADLTNPEKSLTATIVSGQPRGGERTFRYAPLSSGLDIVRKSLARNEIATVQTTAIDEEAGLIRLTTMLAYSSGEWVSSEWPVCLLNETAAPHHMGAALTYARRYALFTLVGIAGEDDVDAPDLAAVARAEAPPPHARVAPPSEPRPSGARETMSAARGRGKSALPAKSLLDPDASAMLRERLEGELGADKKTLTAEDACAGTGVRGQDRDTGRCGSNTSGGL